MWQGATIASLPGRWSIHPRCIIHPKRDWKSRKLFMWGHDVDWKKTAKKAVFFLCIFVLFAFFMTPIYESDNQSYMRVRKHKKKNKKICTFFVFRDAYIWGLINHMQAWKKRFLFFVLFLFFVTLIYEGDN